MLCDPQFDEEDLAYLRELGYSATCDTEVGFDQHPEAITDF